MNPPPNEVAIIGTREEMERAATMSYRARTGLLRKSVQEKNDKFMDMGIVVAEAMVAVVKSESATPKDRTAAAKAFADVSKSHVTIEALALKISETDLAEDVPKKNQLAPPPPPTMINAPGAHFHMSQTENIKESLE